MASITFDEADPTAITFGSGSIPANANLEIHVPTGSEEAYQTKLGTSFNSAMAEKVVIPEVPEMSTTKYEDDINYIKNMQPNTTCSSFLQLAGGGVVKDNNTILNGTDLIGTGKELVVDEFRYVIRVLGDCNGDGKSNINDIFAINKHRLNKVKLTGEYFNAADVTKDGIADFQDILQINKFRLGKINSL